MRMIRRSGWPVVLAPQHPEWQTQGPFASLLKDDLKSALSGSRKAIMQRDRKKIYPWSLVGFLISASGLSAR